MKIYNEKNVLEASIERLRYIFNNFDNIIEEELKGLNYSKLNGSLSHKKKSIQLNNFYGGCR